MSPSRQHLLALLPLLTGLALAQGAITTVAGGAAFLFPTSPVPAIQAPLGTLKAVAADAAGNVYALDASNNQVVKITPAGVLTVLWHQEVRSVFPGGPTAGAMAVDPAGTVYVLYYVNTGMVGVFVFVDKVDPSGAIKGVSVSLSCCFSLGTATDPAGNLYLVDNPRIIKVTPDGTQSTVPALANSPANFSFNGMAVDGFGNFYFSQSDNANGISSGRTQIVKVTPTGVTSIVAGNGTSGFSGDGGPATQAMLNHPTGMAVDASGNLYIADAGNNRIRKVSAAGIITTVAGDSTAGFLGDGGPALPAQLSSPTGVVIDAVGNLYISDAGNSRVRRIDAAGMISTIAGNGMYNVAGDGGPATQAILDHPTDVVVDREGNMYVATPSVNRIRKITSAGVITTIAGGRMGFAGDGGPSTDASLNYPSALAMDAAGDVFITDTNNNRVRKVTPEGQIITVAGGGTGSDCNNCAATSAVLRGPTGIAVDTVGNLYVTDPLNYAVRKVDTGGIISTVVTLSGSADLPNPRTPTRVAVDRDGNLYVVYQGSQTPTQRAGGVIRVGPTGAMTILALGLSQPSGLASGPSGALYFSDDNRVFRVGPDLTAVAVAGTGVQGFSGDCGAAVAAQLFGPQALAVDGDGFLLIADNNNARIRQVIGPACTGAAEPALTVGLQPGFYIAEVRNPPGSRDGYWGLTGMIGQGLIPGGFDLGGAIIGSSGFPGYAAFYLPEAQQVTVRVDAQAIAGDLANTLSLRARLLDSNRQPIGNEELGTSSVQFDRSLNAGFYILEVYSGQRTPPVTFQASIQTPVIAGGVIAGSYVAQGLVGFGAFYVPQPQDVTLQVFGPVNGKNGAGCLQLRLLNASRNVLKTAP